MLHQDVLSYQRVIDSVDDKARTLVQSSSDPQLANFVSQTGSRYEKLCSNAKVNRAFFFIKFVSYLYSKIFSLVCPCDNHSDFCGIIPTDFCILILANNDFEMLVGKIKGVAPPCTPVWRKLYLWRKIYLFTGIK